MLTQLTDSLFPLCEQTQHKPCKLAQGCLERNCRALTPQSRLQEKGGLKLGAQGLCVHTCMKYRYNMHLDKVCTALLWVSQVLRVILERKALREQLAPWGRCCPRVQTRNILEMGSAKHPYWLIPSCFLREPPPGSKCELLCRSLGFRPLR